MSEAGFTCRALWALRDSNLDSADWKVAVALVSLCKPVNGSSSEGEGRPSLGRIATTARTSRAGVRRSLSRLEKGVGPLLVRVERGRVTADGDSDSHRYILTLAGCNQADPTCDQADPTCDQSAPTVEPREPDGCDQPGPTGVTTQAHKEDLSRGSRGSKRKEREARAPRWRRCPDGWEPNEQHRALARERGVNLDAELATFRDHEFQAPKQDADATFRNWLRRARPSAWSGGPAGGVRSGDLLQQTMARAVAAEASERKALS